MVAPPAPAPEASAVPTPVPTGEELAKIMAVNDTWSYRADQDGWILIHNAIRWDMAAIDKALAKLAEQAAAGKPLEPWQTANLNAYVDYFAVTVHEHHDHEEAIFFPVMVKRFTLPPKMTADHKTLIAALDEVQGLVAKDLPAAAGDAAAAGAVLANLQSKFGAMRSEMEEHFREEEDVGLPLVRKYFTQKEFNAGPEKELLKHLTPDSMAYLMRDIPDKAKQAEAMSLLRVPGFIQGLVMRPAIKKDQRTRVRLILELQEGKQIEPEPSKGGCLIM